MPFQFMRFHLDMHIHICTTKMHTCIWKNVATDTSGPRLEYFQLISYFFVTSQQGKIKCVAALEPDFIQNYFLLGICSTLVIIAINVIYKASYTIFSSLGPIFFTLLYICKNTMFSPYGWNLSPITSFRLHFLGTICATLHCVTISHKNLDQTSATKSWTKSRREREFPWSDLVFQDETENSETCHLSLKSGLNGLTILHAIFGRLTILNAGPHILLDVLPFWNDPVMFFGQVYCDFFDCCHKCHNIECFESSDLQIKCLSHKFVFSSRTAWLRRAPPIVPWPTTAPTSVYSVRPTPVST